MIFEYLMTIIKASVTKVSHGGFFELSVQVSK